MERRGKGSAGRSRNAALAALAVGVVVAAGFWPAAHATPSQAAQLVTLLNSPAGENRKRAAVDQLAKLDSAEARNAVKTLADSKDDRVAVLAIAALCRTRFSGAEDKVKSVFEDTGRSNLARGMALAAWCHMKSAAGSTWSQIKAYVKQHAGGNQLLKDQYAASKGKLGPDEVDNDQ